MKKKSGKVVPSNPAPQKRLEKLTLPLGEGSIRAIAAANADQVALATVIADGLSTVVAAVMRRNDAKVAAENCVRVVLQSAGITSWTKADLSEDGKSLSVTQVVDAGAPGVG